MVYDFQNTNPLSLGEFGEVCKGSLSEGRKNIVVAVKRLKRGATLIDQTNLLREACTMAQFNDPNILQLKGVVTKSKKLFELAIETMVIDEIQFTGDWHTAHHVSWLWIMSFLNALSLLVSFVCS